MTDIDSNAKRRTEAKRLRIKRAAYKAGRHTIANIAFSPHPYVICSCEWRYYGDDTEQAWKDHKSDVGERTHHT